LELHGKTALVTGSARRVGRALALALAENGARVAVHYATSEDDAAETVATIRSMGHDAESFTADLEMPSEIERLVSEIGSRFGHFDILVNNASIFGRQDIDSTSVEDWDRYIAVNVRAPFLLSKALKLGLPDGSAGKIINLGDWRTARRNRFPYGVSKAALSGLTRSLAVALAPDIQVNEIALGAILPPVDSPQDPERSQIKMDLGPADRMGTLNEVAGAMLSLIRNDFITGETLHVDGGRHIR
jgi:NAD(P)-dependent dehydrogenase (short-subunit alcohol dehydrogenase family)